MHHEQRKGCSTKVAAPTLLQQCYISVNSGSDADQIWLHQPCPKELQRQRQVQSRGGCINCDSDTCSNSNSSHSPAVVMQSRCGFINPAEKELHQRQQQGCSPGVAAPPLLQGRCISGNNSSDAAQVWLHQQCPRGSATAATDMQSRCGCNDSDFSLPCNGERCRRGHHMR